jgi:hypothetical protein
VSTEVDVGLPDQGEIEAIGIQAKVIRGWSTWRGQRQSPRVESNRSEEYQQGEDRRGEWQIKAVSVIREMECGPVRVFADVGQIHPRTNREGLPPPHQLQNCQLGEWDLHRCRNVFQMQTRKVFEFELTDTIAALEYSSDVIHAFH